MSSYNKDGLGYAAVDKDGNLFGERWTKNEEAFIVRKPHAEPLSKKQLAKLKAKYGEFIDVDENGEVVPELKYGSFGDHGNGMTAITLHTRMATSPKTFANTHPFVDEQQDTSLIHNGVISNVTLADNIRSTCDSERILNRYLAHEVNKVPADIQNAVDDLRGNFACGVFTRDVNGFRVMDVFRSRAFLYGAFVKELDTMVFSTDDDDIKDVCKKLGYTILGKPKMLTPDILYRFNPETGEKLLEVPYRDTANTWTSSIYPYNHGGSHHNSHDDEEWDRQTQTWKKKVDINKGRLARIDEHNRKQAEKNDKLLEDKTKKERKVDGVLVSEAEWMKHVAKGNKGTTITVSELNDNELAEFRECRKHGLSVDEALQYMGIELVNTDNIKETPEVTVGLNESEKAKFQEMLGKGFSVEEAIGIIISDMDSTKDLINKNVDDKFNENEASTADYFRSKEMGLWQKRMKN